MVIIGGARSVSSSSMSFASGLVAVSAFRGGGGYSSKPRVDQTITSATIYWAIFLNESSVVSAKSDKRVWIARPDAPIAVKDDLIYFWDPKYFPNLQEKCTHFVTSNSKQDINICDMKGMNRCSRRIDGARELRHHMFITPESDLLTTFGWLCPNQTVCCEWECCDPHKDYSDAIFMVMLLAFVLLGICIVICLAIPEKKHHYSPAERQGRTIYTSQM
ncbi:hypothetical protein PMAYCL1PPCAC_26426 [Pristionchus mayeri]|uniref:CX domain-containing protein n=1 Tax=Pristionchus mayeri TaxID=1317129 RepID=A0AAN5D4I2_9BILA|nr:hypothetical protein PMAYCL1PPCAC_26426 [Pristionchus mayeri]